MISIIIFSKDRAMQLELCLRSIYAHIVPAPKIYVLYRDTTPDFTTGYTKTRALYPDVLWVRESNFHTNFYDICHQIQTPYFLGLTDDDVVIRPPNLEKLLPAYSDDVATISLRINPKINYCHPAKLELITPEFESIMPILRWRWTKCDARGEWGYPHPINAHVYKMSYFNHLLVNAIFSTPNELEAWLNHHRDLTKPYLIADTKTSILNIPNNLTQTGYTPHNNQEKNSTFALNTLFLRGYKINTDNLYNIHPTQAHAEIPYSYIGGPHD